MAGSIPLFVTGANAVIKIGKTTLAYCNNLSYSLQIKHVKPHVLGMYEPTSVEPMSYEIGGQFSLVKIVAGLRAFYEDHSPNSVVSESEWIGVPNQGTGVGSINDIPDISTKNLIHGTNQELEQHFDPRLLNTGAFFTIDIYQKIGTGDKPNLVPFAQIRGCRITGLQSSLQKGSPIHEVISFDALYLDTDTFLANTSGVGQDIM
jgi:hypothetical protein